MCDDENNERKSPTSSDCEEEDLVQLTRIVKRWWEDDYFEKTDSSLSRNIGRWRRRDPDHEVAFRQMLNLQEKIQAKSSERWNTLAPEHNLALKEIFELQEESLPGCTERKSTLIRRRIQCYVCLKKFLDKDALRAHVSYVHLRKMYNCTVERCSRMFKSRTSMYRHIYIQHGISAKHHRVSTPRDNK